MFFTQVVAMLPVQLLRVLWAAVELLCTQAFVTARRTLSYKSYNLRIKNQARLVY